MGAYSGGRVASPTLRRHSLGGGGAREVSMQAPFPQETREQLIRKSRATSGSTPESSCCHKELLSCLFCRILSRGGGYRVIPWALSAARVTLVLGGISFKFSGMKDEVDTGLGGAGRTASGVAVEEVVNPASLGFIGCGNMAQALLSAFLKKGLVDPHLTIASAPSDRNLSKIRTLGVRTTHNNNEVVRSSDLVFLCVKPHLLNAVLADLPPLQDGHSPLFVSVVTGVCLADLEEMLGSVVENPRVVRSMPNTPSTVGQGCCLYARGSHTTQPDAEATNSLLSSVGMCAEIPEYQMDAACGLAGSGPAYIYAAIEALADGGVKMGLPRQLAQTLAAQTVKGAAAMVLETGKHPGLLKDEVCSPGGTTIAALHTLEKHAFRNCLMSAVEASALRAKELGAKK